MKKKKKVELIETEEKWLPGLGVGETGKGC